MRPTEVWTREESLDADHVNVTTVTLEPTNDGTVTVDVDVVKRFLMEAGYVPVVDG